MTSKISRRNFSVSLLGIGLMAPVAAAMGNVFTSKRSMPGSPPEKPTSRYRIIYFPYRRPRQGEQPVFVSNVVGQTMVIGQPKKEPLTRRFSVKNNSDKAIKEIQISLLVMVDKHTFMPILNQVNSRYVFNSALLPQAEQIVKGEDSLKDLCGSLFVDGQLNGGYRVEVLVSKAWYEDGSTWEVKGPIK